MLVMLVENDSDYADLISYTLRWDQHDTVTLVSAAQAVAFSNKRRPDLAVVETALPDESGIRLCTHLHKTHPGLPVIMLGSPSKSGEVIAALRSGADDYLRKPFHPAELLARVEALLRRASKEQPAEAGTGLQLDAVNNRVYLNGVDLRCTPIELDIVAQFLRYEGEALSHQFLTEQVWGYTEVVNATMLKTHISALRRKIKDAGGDENMIRTAHGFGYIFVPPARCTA